MSNDTQALASALLGALLGTALGGVAMAWTLWPALNPCRLIELREGPEWVCIETVRPASHPRGALLTYTAQPVQRQVMQEMPALQPQESE